MSKNQLNPTAASITSASNKVFSELESLYDALDRLESILINKFDSLHVQPQDIPAAEPVSKDLFIPCSQTFSGLFSKAQNCTSYANRLIEYVHNCES